MSAQSEGNYAEALQNYYEAMRLEIDRSASISNFRKRVRAFSSCSMAPSRRSSEFRIVVNISHIHEI